MTVLFCAYVHVDLHMEYLKPALEKMTLNSTLGTFNLLWMDGERTPYSHLGRHQRSSIHSLISMLVAAVVKPGAQGENVLAENLVFTARPSATLGLHVAIVHPHQLTSDGMYMYVILTCRYNLVSHPDNSCWMQENVHSTLGTFMSYLLSLI